MGPPTIYYFCPDVRGVSGGVRVMYRHVDVLNRNNIPAAILHSTNGFRCSWFSNKTRIAYVKSTEFKKEDVIVFPEVHLAYFTDSHNPGDLELQIKRMVSKSRHKYYANMLSKVNARKVIFNQNAYLTFEGIHYDLDYEIPYLREDVAGTLCVSDDTYQYLKHIFPELSLFKIRHSAESSCFYFQPQKKAQIAFIADRNLTDLNQVLNILKIQKITEGLRLVAIKNKTEKEVAQILRDSAVFLSFGRAEGFSLPPMEAMLCGCVVVGYHGRGGREYFNPEFSYPVEAGDVIAFAKSAGEVISAYKADPSSLLAKGKLASEQISIKYNARNEEADLIKAWSEILT